MSAEPTLYVAIQASIYRHVIVGAFNTVDDAIEGAKQAITNENDHYHQIDIHEIPVGYVCSFNSRGRAIDWPVVALVGWQRTEPEPRCIPPATAGDWAPRWRAWRQSGEPTVTRYPQ